MNRIQKNGLTYYQFKSLEPKAGLIHGVFTRIGGVSEGPLTSLNVGALVGDQPERVVENVQRMAAALGTTRDALRTVWQVHGDAVEIVSHGDEKPSPPPKADVILTSDPGVPLTMRFADCVPLLLYDPIKDVLALAHAGWKGTALKVGAVAVKAMVEGFGCDPKAIIAGIGPSIGPDHYEVGAEVIATIRNAFPNHPELLRSSARAGHAYLDLWEANRVALYEMGVRLIETAGISTFAQTDDFFSHRASGGQTGRFGMVAMLTEGA